MKTIEKLKLGKGILVVDNENRENEGDIIFPAKSMTVSDMALMIRECSGIVCLCLTPEKGQSLGLYPMVNNNTSKNQTAFTISIEAKEGITTGVSAADRITTIRTAVAKDAKPDQLSHPGHIFPLIGRPNGVFERGGHTEGSIDLVKLAGLGDSAVLCELTNEDGSMARLPEIIAFAEKHDMVVVSIEDIYKYRLQTETVIRRETSASLPTKYGNFKIIPYTWHDGTEHMALVKGEWNQNDNVLVRVHSSCATGDLFGSYRCDCGEQLHESMRMIEKEGKGVIVYLDQEGRGIGLVNKIKAYKLQEEGRDTVEANVDLGFKPDERDYGIGALILKDLGVGSIRLITNNPHKERALKGYGINVTELIPLEIQSNTFNHHYLEVKKEKMGHLLHLANHR
jgi:3,4-dihydroxy 2-butanone 4-phosphate synthase/GTP cyclohydrolase II